MESVRWAASNGLNLLSSSVIAAGDAGREGEVPLDFAEIQAAQIREFRSLHPAPATARVSQGLVVIPTDSATTAQKEKYRAYVDARTPRTLQPSAPSGTCSRVT
jgi:hypothetical protein